MAKKEIHIGDGDHIKIERPFPWRIVILVITIVMVAGGIAAMSLWLALGRQLVSTPPSNLAGTPSATPMSTPQSSASANEPAPFLTPKPTPEIPLSGTPKPTSTPIQTPSAISPLTNLPTAKPALTPVETPSLPTPIPIFSPTLKKEEWSRVDVGSGKGGMNALTIGIGRNDKVTSVYATSKDQHLYEFRFEKNTWQKIDIGKGGPATLDDTTGIAIGVGRYDGVVRVYSSQYDGTYSGSFSEFTFSGDVWNRSVTYLKRYGGTLGLVSGNGRNDGTARIYTVNWGEVKGISEFTYLNGKYNEADIGSAPDFSVRALGLGPGRNDSINRLYSVSSDGNITEFTYLNNTWAKVNVGSVPSPMRAIAIGDGHNDGVVRVYVANNDGNIYEYTFAKGGWNRATVGYGGGQMLSVVTGSGRSDKVNRVYAANQDGYIYEFSYLSGDWEKKVVGKGNSAMRSLRVGDGRNEGVSRVYGANDDGHVYEFSFALALTTATASRPTSTTATVATPALTPLPAPKQIPTSMPTVTPIPIKTPVATPVTSPSSVLTSTPIISGSSVKGQLTFPGEVHWYSFNAKVGDSVYIVLTEGVKGSPIRPWLGLLSPGGTVVYENWYDASVQIDRKLTEAGRYTIRVRDYAIGVGPYVLSFSQLSQGGGKAISPGMSTQGQLGFVGEVHWYNFEAKGGDSVYIVLTEGVRGSPIRPWLSLLSPSGTVLYENWYDESVQIDRKLTETGRYTIRVRDYAIGTGPYVLSFNLLSQ